jgi:hypothetical protein
MLLKATFATTGKPVSRRRFFLVSALGALFALFFPLIEGVAIVGVLYKISTGLLMVLLALKHFTFRSYYITAITFITLTFLTGGAIMGVFNILGIDYSSEISIALMFTPVYLLIKIFRCVIKYFSKRNALKTFLYQVKIKNGKKEILAQGFLDSGNTVYDRDSPVVFLTKRLAKKLVSENSIKNPPFKMEIVTVSGKTSKTAFKTQSLEIYIDGVANIFKNVTVCVADDRAFDGYELILHPTFFCSATSKILADKESEDYERRNKQIKEVS